MTDETAAIRLDPTYVFAYSDRGLAEIYLKQDGLAVADCRQAVALDRYNAMIRYNCGLTEAGVGDLQGAITELRMAARLYRIQGDGVGYRRTEHRLRTIRHRYNTHKDALR